MLASCVAGGFISTELRFFFSLQRNNAAYDLSIIVSIFIIRLKDLESYTNRKKLIRKMSDGIYFVFGLKVVDTARTSSTSASQHLPYCMITKSNYSTHIILQGRHEEADAPEAASQACGEEACDEHNGDQPQNNQTSPWQHEVHRPVSHNDTTTLFTEYA